MASFRLLRQLRRTVSGNVGSLRYYLGDAVGRRDDSSLPGDTVVLIQGFMQTRRVMDTLERRLRSDGFRVVSFHLGGLLNNFNTRGIASLAALINSKIQRLREREDIGKIHIIGHSKGGLIARYLVQRAGGADYTTTVITLGTPHHGTPVAALGMGVGLFLVSRSIWELFPQSPLIKELNADPFPAGVRLVSVYSSGDIVCPYQRSMLTLRDGADVRNVMTRGLGHMELVEDPYVYGLLLRELQQQPIDSASGPVAAFDEEVTGYQTPER
jgi:pimeloyl-ACP methyl ester carboxylesterase